MGWALQVLGEECRDGDGEVERKEQRVVVLVKSMDAMQVEAVVEARKVEWVVVQQVEELEKASEGELHSRLEEHRGRRWQEKLRGKMLSLSLSSSSGDPHRLLVAVLYLHRRLHRRG